MIRARVIALAAASVATACGPAEPDDAFFDELLETGTKLYSQHDEELVIRHFFRDRKGGVFVDVGAYHWKNNSTTYYLEEHLGWSGIAIDAMASLGAGYAANRPRTRFESYIVTDHSGTTETLYLAGPLSSVFEKYTEFFPKHREKYGKPEEGEVSTITLNELLDRNGIRRIDFLSMDIEGGEPAALAGFDIERFRPELVCIEAGPFVQDPIAAYFAAHGYERIDAYLAYDELNWYFRPADR